MKTKELLKIKDELISELKKKSFDAKPLVDEIEKKYESLKISKQEFDSLRENTNKISKEIAKEKDPVKRKELISSVSNNKAKIAESSETFKRMEEEIEVIKNKIPNMPSKESPVGPDESFNKIIKEVPFKDSGLTYKPHWDLINERNIVDEEASIKLSGARFVVYKGKGAQLLEAIKTFMINTHIGNGYELYNVPVIVNSNNLVGTGQLPKFADDLYKVNDDQWLIPTAEVSLTNMYNNTILDESELPKKMVAYSNCFRKEAGASGRDTRGIKRLHQFNKVELVHILQKEDESKLLQEMLSSATAILDALELPYRVVELSTGELTFSSSFTYDIEVWMPGQNEYMEISSVSTCTDFQGSRMNSRVNTKDGKEFIYTQNGSGLAIDRTIAAIVENYQNANGEIEVPKVLQPFMLNIKKI